MDLLISETARANLDSSMVAIVIFAFMIFALIAFIKRYSADKRHRFTIVPIMVCLVAFSCLLIGVFSPAAVIIIPVIASWVAYCFVPTYHRKVVINPNTHPNQVLKILNSKHIYDPEPMPMPPIEVFSLLGKWIKSYQPTTPLWLTLFNSLLLVIAFWAPILEITSGQVTNGFGIVDLFAFVVVIVIPLMLLAAAIKIYLLKRSWIDRFMIICWLCFILIVAYYAW